VKLQNEGTWIGVKDQIFGTPQHCGVQSEEHEGPFRSFELGIKPRVPRLAQIQLSKLPEGLEGKLQSRFVSQCATPELATHLVAHESL